MKTMPVVEDKEHTDVNMAFSCDSMLESLSAISDTTRRILQSFQDSILDAKPDSIVDLKKEREQIRTELRECLAQGKSLRRKDFDNMMRGILSAQDEREKEGRNLLNNYFIDQKSMTGAIRENLAQFKESLIKGEIERVKEFQIIIKEILVRQDERKVEVVSKLKEFQKEQQEMVKKFKELLSKGRELRIKDFKEMLNGFKSRHTERSACRQKRKKEVRSMLAAFKRERVNILKGGIENGNS